MSIYSDMESATMSRCQQEYEDLDPSDFCCCREDCDGDCNECICGDDEE